MECCHVVVGSAEEKGKILMAKILLHGFLGKMGQTVLRLADESPNCEVVAGVDINLQSAINPFPAYTDISDCDMIPDVIIDFTDATAMPGLLEYALKHNIPTVICTTGLKTSMVKKIEAAATQIPIFRSANMSFGVNLISVILKKISKPLYENDFDIEIVEKHHRQKIDSPSGTAFLLADSINDGLDSKFEYIYDRLGTLKPRGDKEIGIQAIRGGGIIGDHSVIFASPTETIEISHSAITRDIFAVGALNAALFLKDKNAGLYKMEHLIEEQFM